MVESVTDAVSDDEVDERVENHRSTETHDTAQPPEEHDNEVHDRDFVDEGEAAAAAPVQSVNGQQGDVEVGGIPEGVILMWSGATTDVPSGFTLCDGTDGTPDLTDRFIVGAGGSFNVGDTGGQETVSFSDSTTAEVFRSDNSIQIVNGNESPPFDIGVGDSVMAYGTDFRTGLDNPRTIEIEARDAADEPTVDRLEADVSVSDSDDNSPPFFSLAYIMKV